MGSLTRNENLKNKNENKSIIPEYAKDYKREWQYIRGINKTCGIFLKKLHKDDCGGKLFNIPIANSLKYHIKNFLKAQESGRLKDVSNFYFKYSDADNIEYLEEQMSYYIDIYVDPDSFEFNQEYYDLRIDRDYPGFKELIGLLSSLNDKIKREDPIIIFKSDSDSDSEDYYNDLNNFINFCNNTIRYSDSESD